MIKKIGKTIKFQIINKKTQQKVEVKNVTQGGFEPPTLRAEI